MQVRNQFNHGQLSRSEFFESSWSQTMRAFSKIIVERQDGHWSAWFEDLPQIAIGGELPSQAIHQLLQHVGAANFDNEGIVAVAEGTRDGHLEFLVPLMGFRRIPIPSLN